METERDRERMANWARSMVVVVVVLLFPSMVEPKVWHYKFNVRPFLVTSLEPWCIMVNKSNDLLICRL